MTISCYQLEPFRHIGPLAFGMTIQQVGAVLGTPARRRERPDFVRVSWAEPWIACRISQAVGLEEVEFAPGGHVLVVDGVQVLEDPDALQRLCFADPTVRRTADGLLLFPRYGLALSGIFPRDPDQMAASVSSLQAWERRARFPSKPFIVSD